MLHRRTRRAVWAWGVVAGASGCHYDDWSLATPDAAPDGVVATDSETPSVDAPVAESEPPADAPVEVGPSTWCGTVSPVPFLCLDFDEGRLDLAYVDGAAQTISPPSVDDGGTASLVTTDATSPPGALFVSTPSIDAGSNSARYSNPLAFSQTTSTTSVQFAMKIGELSGTTGRLVIVALSLSDPSGDASTDFTAFFTLVPPTFKIGLAGGMMGYHEMLFTSALPKDVWVPIRLQLTTADPKSTPPGVLKLYVSGTEAGSLTDTPAFVTAASAKIQIGLSALAPVAAGSLTLDNIVFGR